MISYELTKQLKEAEFPFDWQRKCPLCEEEGSHSSCPNPFPTLSELIEACGDDFVSLVKNRKGFFVIAEVEDYRKKGSGVTEYYSSPEEAVASLFLMLRGGKISE